HVNVHRHDVSVASHVEHLLAVAAPVWADAAALRYDPLPAGTSASLGVKGPHVGFILTGLVGCIRKEPTIREKTNPALIKLSLYQGYQLAGLRRSFGGQQPAI